MIPNVLVFRLMLFVSLVLNLTWSYAQNTIKPNVIYIYADDLGYAETSPYGQSIIRTPNLQKLANEGMVFSEHYAGAPVCAPSRAMLMTGKNAGKSYIRGNHELGGFADSLEAGQLPLPSNTFTLAQMMKNAGYATGLVGKWGLGFVNNSGEPSKQGFDYYFSVLDQKQAHNYYPTHLWENGKKYPLLNQEITVHKRIDLKTATDADFNYFIGQSYAPASFTDKAKQFISSHQKQPFFLYLAYPLPHVSLQIPAEDLKRFGYQFPQDSAYDGRYGYNATKTPKAVYATMISYLDEQVGKIMQHVKELGMDDHTIVMFSSDNGATFAAMVDTKFFKSEGNLRGLKMDLYEGGIKIPFIVRWPHHIKPNSKSNLMSAQYDVMATLAALTGQNISTHATDGISFLPTLLGNTKSQKKHDFLYFEYPEKGGQIAVRWGKWKGVKTHLLKNPNAQWQLFDLEKDPSESNDIAKRFPKVLKQMDAIVQKEHQKPVLAEWDIFAERNAQ